MNEGTRSGKSTIRLLGISAERPTNGLYLYLLFPLIGCLKPDAEVVKHVAAVETQQII
jgi:hypothetical protein